VQRNRDRAFSYIELLASIASLAIILAASLPGWQQNLSGHRLARAAEDLAQDLRSARNLSLTHNKVYFVHYDNSTHHGGSGLDAASWCTLRSTQTNCHCLAPNPAAACLEPAGNDIQRVDSHDHPGIHLVEARFGGQNYTRFDPARGTARFGRLRLQDDFQRSLQINVSLLGRVRICRPAGTISTGSYAAC